MNDIYPFCFSGKYLWASSWSHFLLHKKYSLITAFIMRLMVKKHLEFSLTENAFTSPSFSKHFFHKVKSILSVGSFLCFQSDILILKISFLLLAAIVSAKKSAHSLIVDPWHLLYLFTNNNHNLAMSCLKNFFLCFFVQQFYYYISRYAFFSFILCTIFRVIGCIFHQFFKTSQPFSF